MLPAVQRYLDHAFVDGDPGHDAITLDMSGRIKLGERWLDFSSTLHIDALRAFTWQASVRQGLLRIRGHDLYRDGHGEMLWKLYGLFPVMKADDPETSHSARGRAALEQVFLPSALARPEVRWSMAEDGWLQARWHLDGEEVGIDLHTDDTGRPLALRSERWSDADGMPHHFVTFGGDLFEEGVHAGMRIPTRLEAGWFYGEERWEEGRFFEATVHGVET